MPHDLQSLITSLSAQLGADPHPITAAELEGLTALLPLVDATLAATFGPWHSRSETDHYRVGKPPAQAGFRKVYTRDGDYWDIGGGGQSLQLPGVLPVEFVCGLVDLLLRARGYRLVDE